MSDFSPDVYRIAKRLNETKKGPLGQIQKIIDYCGIEFAEFMVENTMLIEEAGGMKTVDGSRQRTTGGIFFYIVRHALPNSLRLEIFPPKVWQKRPERKPSPYPEFHWDNRVEELQDALEKEKGKVDELSIQIKGRPGHVERRDGLCIMTIEENIGENQTFPRGVPEPPNDMTRYIVYIGEEQWEKHVGNKIDKDDRTQLVVTGACYFDESLESMAVFARSVKVQRKKKEDPKPKQEKPKPKQEQEEQEAEAEDIPDLSNYPPEVAKKLRPLYGARKLFRKRLADIEAQPKEKQSGLKAAQMMLERTEKQIEMLEKQTK
jgi:hypothetical protein